MPQELLADTDLVAVVHGIANRVKVIGDELSELHADLTGLASIMQTLTAEPLEAAPEVSVIEKQPLDIDEPEHSAGKPTDEEDSAPTDDALDYEAPPLQADDEQTVVCDSVIAQRRTPYRVVTDNDLAAIEQRCHLKAEAARFTTERRRFILDGADFENEIKPKDLDLVQRAKAVDCFLWMIHAADLKEVEESRFSQIAGCYDTLATAIALVRETLEDSRPNRSVFQEALFLLAQCQSALMVAVARLIDRQDDDQAMIYFWIKATTQRHSIRLDRYMGIDSPADPSEWPQTNREILELYSQFHRLRSRDESRRKRIGRARHHAQALATASDSNQKQNWQDLVVTIDDLVSDGVPPSNIEIRELLLPVIDELPATEKLPDGFRLVLREIDWFRASREYDNSEDIAEPPTDAVREVARLLRKRSIVLIGGIRREHSEESLRESFALKSLKWIETTPHVSYTRFEPPISRPEVAVVVLAIRWASHSFGNVKQFCDRYDKPLVRLPGGVGVNQVASEILSQCGDRLRERYQSGNADSHVN